MTNHQEQCEHNHAFIKSMDTSEHVVSNGVIMSFSCPDCKKTWDTHYAYKNDTSYEIVITDIPQGAGAVIKRIW
jgi:hypothetical protein